MINNIGWELLSEPIGRAMRLLGISLAQNQLDPEVHEFVLNHYHELKFGNAKEIHIRIQRMNPKRLQREARREMEKIKETTRPSTLAQEYMREEIEKKKER